MKKQCIILSALLMMTSGLFGLTDTDAKRRGQDLLQGMVSAHTLAFGQAHILQGNLNLNSWNLTIKAAKDFVTQILNSETPELSDYSILGALKEITKAESDLVATINEIRTSPENLAQHIALLTQIKNNMLAVQDTLRAKRSSVPKTEAQSILRSAAMFIDATATHAAREANELNQ
jgi:hypothetical protein